jgi:hypothetical protein
MDPQAYRQLDKITRTWSTLIPIGAHQDSARNLDIGKSLYEPLGIQVVKQNDKHLEYTDTHRSPGSVYRHTPPGPPSLPATY